MKIKFLAFGIWLVMLFITVQAQAVVTQNTTNDNSAAGNLSVNPSEPDLEANSVSFYKSIGVESLSFEYINSYVTAGVPYTPEILTLQDNDQLVLVFVAGRKKSAEVANKFNEFNNQACIHMMAFTYYKCKPEGLNFAISTKMFINDSETTGIVYLAQGSAFLMHVNWWIGSPEGYNSKNQSFAVQTVNGRKYHILIYGNYSTQIFTVRAD